MCAVREVYYRLLKVTRCKNCGGKLCKKVTMCESGHTVCETCYNSLDVCSRCNGEFFDRYHIFYNNVISALRDKTNFLDKLIEIIECPVCYEHLTCPSWTCWNGHITCGRCYFYTSTCPLCREEYTTLYNADINSLLNLLESPIECINRIHGCDHKDRYARLRTHESECHYKQFTCLIHGCEWTGFLNKMSSHVAVKHPKQVLKVEDSCVDFEIETENANDRVQMISNGKESFWLQTKSDPLKTSISLIYFGQYQSKKTVMLTIQNRNYTIPISSICETIQTDGHTLKHNSDMKKSKTVNCNIMLNSRSTNWLANALFLTALAANLTFAIIILKKNIN